MRLQADMQVAELDDAKGTLLVVLPLGGGKNTTEDNDRKQETRTRFHRE
jgi:hypothetical protein